MSIKYYYIFFGDVHRPRRRFRPTVKTSSLWHRWHFHRSQTSVHEEWILKRWKSDAKYGGWCSSSKPQLHWQWWMFVLMRCFDEAAHLTCCPDSEDPSERASDDNILARLTIPVLLQGFSEQEIHWIIGRKFYASINVGMWEPVNGE